MITMITVIIIIVIIIIIIIIMPTVGSDAVALDVYSCIIMI